MTRTQPASPLATDRYVMRNIDLTDRVRLVDQGSDGGAWIEADESVFVEVGTA